MGDRRFSRQGEPKDEGRVGRSEVPQKDGSFPPSRESSTEAAVVSGDTHARSLKVSRVMGVPCTLAWVMDGSWKSGALCH